MFYYYNNIADCAATNGLHKCKHPQMNSHILRSSCGMPDFQLLLHHMVAPCLLWGKFAAHGRKSKIPDDLIVTAL